MATNRIVYNNITLHNIPKAIEKSPAYNAYTDFLINNAFNSPYPVAVAALLPCFWIYYKTGEYVLNNTVNNNPYRKWIDTYSGDEYIQYTTRFIYITENLGQKASPIIREQMENAFIEGTKNELRVLEEASKQ
jgi:thiaminase/transcriptional activator TenA